MNKKIFPIMMLATVVTLSGCSLPFVQKQSDKVETYVKNNTEIVKASDNINQELNGYLDSVVKKGRSFKKQDVAKRIQVSKEIQTDLFKTINNEKSNEVTKELKSLYLKVMNEYLKQYKVYDNAIQSEDSKILEAAIKENKLKKEGTDKMYLQKINTVIENEGAKKLTDLKTIGG